MSKLVKVAIYTLLFMLSGQTVMAQEAPLPLTFQFTFCEGLQSDAQARGWITFDENLMSNPFSGGIDIPDPIILDLNVEITNSATGNGSFTIDDFYSIAWNSNGGTLDFDLELVGQPTDGRPWGATPSEGEAGDFNLFGITESDPNGVWWFTLASSGGSGEEMVLVSMIKGTESPGTAVCNVRSGEAVPVPTIDQWGKTIMFLLLTALAAFALRRRVKQH